MVLCPLFPDRIGIWSVRFCSDWGRSALLYFTEAPQISISSVEASYIEGSLVNISCTATGKRDPEVKWLRNGIVKSLGKQAALLTFSNINRADDGQYTCSANNSAGNDVKHVRLVVHCK